MATITTKSGFTFNVTTALSDDATDNYMVWAILASFPQIGVSADDFEETATDADGNLLVPVMDIPDFKSIA